MPRTRTPPTAPSVLCPNIDKTKTLNTDEIVDLNTNTFLFFLITCKTRFEHYTRVFLVKLGYYSASYYYYGILTYIFVTFEVVYSLQFVRILVVY